MLNEYNRCIKEVFNMLPRTFTECGLTCFDHDNQCDQFQSAVGNCIKTTFKKLVGNKSKFCLHINLFPNPFLLKLTAYGISHNPRD